MFTAAAQALQPDLVRISWLSKKGYRGESNIEDEAIRVLVLVTKQKAVMSCTTGMLLTSAAVAS